MSDPRGTHNDLHSERGALAGEHSGRATNPVIKVHDLAWLEFQKPDLARAETFAHAFVFATVVRMALDAMAAGGQYLIDQGSDRSWGIGRTSRAVRSSTTGGTRTASSSSTSPTATCSTAPSSRDGRR